MAALTAARTASDRLVIAHQKEVATVAGGVASAVIQTAMGADPAAISTWFYAAFDGLVARIQAGYALNRRSAMGYLPQHGALNGVSVSAVPGSLDTGALKARLNITGPVAFKTAIGAGRDEQYALRSMSTQMGGLADELVRDGDRDVLMQTIRQGRGIVAYRRRLAGKSCGFCAMLASRGAVYGAETVGFRTHAHCRCFGEPLYRRQHEPPEVQRLQRQWQRVTAGKSGNDAIRTWRRHWEQKTTPAARVREGIAEPVVARSIAAPSTPGGVGTDGIARPVVEIRQALQSARSAVAVSRAFEVEARRITGRTIDAEFKGSVLTAREHAEGLLRGLERLPKANLRSVESKALESSAYAETQGPVIRFNTGWTSDRRRYLNALDKDVGDGVYGWHPAGTNSPVAVALHEFGHVLDLETLGLSAQPEIRSLVENASKLSSHVRPGTQLPIARELHVGFEISRYATTDGLELAAEAFSDVMMNGAAASRLSHDIYGVLVSEYKLGAGPLGPVRPVIARSMPAPADLSGKTVAQLKALAKERGITGYSKLTKPQLLERLGGETKPKPKAGSPTSLAERVTTRPAVAMPADLSKLKVTELRALAKERGIAGYSKLTKPQLLDALGKPKAVVEPENPLIIAARERQAAIDYARARADLLSTAQEWLNNQGSLESMAVRLRADAVRLGVEGHKDVAALFRAIDSKDEAKIVKAIEAIGKKQNLTRIERAGDVVKYDPKLHGDIGKDLKTGEHAVVVRPGYTFSRDGEVIRLSKATVEKATKEEIAARGKVSIPVEKGKPIPSPEIETAHARIEEIVQALPSTLRSDISEGLMSQAAIAPRSVGRLVGVGFDLGDNPFPQPGFARYLPLKAAIELNPEWKTNKAALMRLLRSSQRDGYLTPTGLKSPLAGAVAHEFGHRMAFRLYQPSSPGLRPTGQKLIDGIAQALGVGKPSRSQMRGDTMPWQTVDSWMAANRRSIAKQVSEYASESFHELVAELWQEYSTRGERVRPAAKQVGKLMVDLLAAGGGA